MVIAIDFDGTCVTHEFPLVGKEIGALPVLKALVAKGHQLVLFTMRSNVVNPKSDEYDIEAKGGNYLDDAVQWFKDHDIPLYGINENPKQKEWTHSPKAYAQLYIDDAALGVPLRYPEIGRPYVNWTVVTLMLQERRIL